MTLIERAKTSHRCIICDKDIVIGEAYLQSVKDFKGGMAIVAVHANHLANDKKNLKHISRIKARQIEKICDSAVELSEAGMTIKEAVKESKKLHGWSMWM